tara:strand:- start:4 stop:651 length:648 start_codon:yes stop_codon:yes gene_type:complete
MEYLPQFILTYSIFMIGAISPGPDAIVLLKTAIQNGRRYAYFVALGLGGSIFTVCISILLGLSLLFQEFPFLIYVIQYGGSGFLIFLGVQSFLSKGANFDVRDESKQTYNQVSDRSSQVRHFRNGFMTNFLNPFAILYLISLLSVKIAPETPVLYKVLFSLFLGGSYFLWNATLSFIPTNKWLKAYVDQYAGGLQKVSGGLLIFIGVQYAMKSLG